MKKAVCLVIYIFSIFLFSGLMVSSAWALQLEKHSKLQEIANTMIAEHGYSRSELDALFANVQLKPEIVASMQKPAEALKWHQYRGIFLKPERISSGVDFWYKYAAVIKRASQKYSVPEHIIVAIIGVETRYGEYKGKHTVLDSLSTLIELFPKRSAFFSRELVEFLKLTKEHKLDAANILGSYAGAMGYPQFIASSYRAYAVDFNGDGKIDLINQPEDAIGSVANYFKVHGWQYEQPVVFKIEKSTWQLSKLSNRKLKATETADYFRQKGLSLSAQIADDKKLNVIKLRDKHRSNYYAALENFYVITRYNRSVLYAMAVHQLSEAIKLEKDAG